MYRRQVRRRRAVLALLIAASLTLLSISFQGGLRGFQGGVGTVLGPIEEAASRALKPARDLVNWFDETFEARGENEQLHDEVAELRAQVAEAQSAVGENAEFEKMLEIDFDNDGEPIVAGDQFGVGRKR